MRMYNSLQFTVSCSCKRYVAAGRTGLSDFLPEPTHNYVVHLRVLELFPHGLVVFEPLRVRRLEPLRSPRTTSTQ